MPTTVLRYKCDLCGRTHMLEAVAKWCEQMCAEEAEKSLAQQTVEELTKAGNEEDVG